MAAPRTVLGVVKKVIEWYKTHQWTTGTLYSNRPPNKGYCILGAATACVTNDQLLRKYPNELSHPTDLEHIVYFPNDEDQTPKNLNLVADFEYVLDSYLLEKGITEDGAIEFNDTYAYQHNGKETILEVLDDLRKKLERERRNRSRSR